MTHPPLVSSLVPNFSTTDGHYCVPIKYHERIPERVVHAHGYFQPYGDYYNVTAAKLLHNPEVKSPVFVRISTVLGSRGSADTVGDVRGFASRFYTEKGLFDIVGNDIPVFFIQDILDAIKFPHLVHASKLDLEVPEACVRSLGSLRQV
ncbi:catalase [Basidiobolus ranarum]|uniref:catalase n=1 Tax=Basidiobolus ranarum TaxID=34480 RepID=A0ABR2WD94_9FUNG